MKKFRAFIVFVISFISLIGIRAEEVKYHLYDEKMNLDYNNYILEYGEFKSEKEDFPYREFNEKVMYEVNEINKIRYIHLKNFNAENFFYINEIFVRNKQGFMDFQIFCEGCTENFETLVKNGNTMTQYSKIEIDGYLRIDLLDYYNLDEITIEIYMTDKTLSEKKYDLFVTREETLDRIYTTISERLFFTHNSNAQFHKSAWNLANILFVDPETITYTTENIPKQTKLNSFKEITMYQSIDKLFAIVEEKIEPETIESEKEEAQQIELDQKEETKITIDDNKVINDVTPKEKPIINDTLTLPKKSAKKTVIKSNTIEKPEEKIEQKQEEIEEKKQIEKEDKKIINKEEVKKETFNYKNSLFWGVVILLLIGGFKYVRSYFRK